MAAEQKKELFFTFKVDQTALNNLKNAIKSITDDMNKLIQTASAISRLGGAGSAPVVGGGGGISAQGIQTKFQMNTSQGGGLGGVFSSAGQSATQGAAQVKSATTSMLSDIQRLVRGSQAMTNLSAQQGNPWSKGIWGGSGGGGGPPVLHPSPMYGPSNNMLGGGPPSLPPASFGNPSPPPGMSGGGSWAQGGMKGMRMAGAGLALGATGVNLYYNEMMQGGGHFNTGGGFLGGDNKGFTSDQMQMGSRWYMGAQGDRGSMMESRMRSMGGGDLKFGYALHNLTAAGARGVAFESGNTALGSGIWKGTLGMGTKTVGQIPIIGNLMPGGGGSGGSIMSGLNRETMENSQIQETLARVDEAQQSNPYMNMALDRFSGSQGSRTAAMLAGVVGGTKFRRRDPAFIGKYAVMDQDRGPLVGSDSFGQLDSDLMEQGYSVGDLTGARHGLLGAGAKYAHANARLAMYASGAGYGQFSGLLSTAGHTGGGRAFALGSVGAGVDAAAGISLGAGILGTGFDPRGTTSGMGLLGAAQANAGFQNDSGDVNRVNRLLAGADLGSNILTGKVDGYQMGRNFVSASSIMGKGGGFYAADALSGMNMKQMADVIGDGKLTNSMIAHGISAKDVEKQFGSSVSSVFDRWKSNDRNDPMNNAIRAYKKSGMELPDYLQSLQGNDRTAAMRNLGVFAGEQLGQGAEGGEGLMQIVGGIHNKATAGKIGAVLDPNSAEGKLAKAQADINRGLVNEFAKELEKVFGGIAKSPGDVKTMGATGGNIGQTAREFIDALDSIITHISTITGYHRAVPKRKGK